MGLNFDALKSELNDIQTSQGSLYPRLKLHQGLNVLRIMPEYDEKGMFYAKFRMHWKIGDKTFPCERTWDRECYLCEVVKILREQGKEKVANRWLARAMYLMNCVNMESIIEQQKGVQVVSMSKQPMGQLLELISNPKFANLIDPKTGRNIFLKVQGTGIETTYTLYPDADGSPLPNIDQLLKGLYKLHELARPAAPGAMEAAVKKVLAGGGAADDMQPSVAPAPAITAPPPSSVVPPAPSNPAAPAVSNPSAGAPSVATRAKLDEFLKDFERH